MLTIDTRNLNEPAPLWHRYPAQTSPQPAFLSLTEAGEASADYSGEIGNAVPMAVWHGRTLRWRLPCEVRGAALAGFLASGEARALLQRVHRGQSVEWDGSNHVGRLDADAQAARDALDSLIERELHADGPAAAQIWTAGDWLWSSCTLLQHWHTQPLADAVAQVEADAAAEGIVIDGDMQAELLAMAEHWCDTGRAGLTAAHITALIQAGRIGDEDATRYAMTMPARSSVEGVGKPHA